MSELIALLSGPSEGGDPSTTIPDMSRAIIHGSDRAESFVKKVVQGKKVHNKIYSFGEAFIREIHRRATYYHPGTAGTYRIDDEVRICGHQPRKARDLPLLMYKFGQWLDESTRSVVENDDLVQALGVAAAAHYGLSYDLHPFYDGNKRTAMWTANAILMAGTDELKHFSTPVPPIPQIRSYQSEYQIAEMMAEGKVVKLDSYVRSILAVEETGMLNPLKLHFANIWARNMVDRLKDLHGALKGKSLTATDAYLIQSFTSRLTTLENYIVDEAQRNRAPDPIPDFFAPQRVHVDHAKTI